MFIAVVFTISRAWKEPRSPSTEEWIEKLWYIYTMECYSSTERNAFESVLMRWTKLEPIIQSEISQKVKCKYCMKVKVTQSCLTLQPHGLYSPWNSPSQNTGAGSLCLFQGIFSTQGSNLGLPHCRWILYCMSHQGIPYENIWFPMRTMYLRKWYYQIRNSQNNFSFMYHIMK